MPPSVMLRGAMSPTFTTKDPHMGDDNYQAPKQPYDKTQVEGADNSSSSSLGSQLGIFALEGWGSGILTPTATSSTLCVYLGKTHTSVRSTVLLRLKNGSPCSSIPLGNQLSRLLLVPWFSGGSLGLEVGPCTSTYWVKAPQTEISSGLQYWPCFARIICGGRNHHELGLKVPA
ncbi:hypothetical protein N656DRAFT_784112 [Canariomyces notabilis]|uniref:Uncharacterized protein n=1 Tax=Canariomyces notabilis TaxID=2074819 RepID=A0AAN6QED8_9PEZI|nr:hypothetical protein N656DRAFT_784112 [Canariomyces arenarius]